MVTQKQEIFAQTYIEIGNATEAYRRAYDTSKTKPNVVRVRACQILAKPEVKARVAELRANALSRHQLTVEDIVGELEEARALAMSSERPQTAAMVAATMGKAKVLGLITEKTEVTGANGRPIQHSLEVRFVRSHDPNA